MPKLADKIRVLVRWLERKEIRRSLPRVYQFGDYEKARVIIDCTEIFVDRPKNLTLRAHTWSSYKHHNTVKLLVGITPNGGVSFVSRAFGGRVSDKVITQRSGFLDLLEHDDLVLADRGFLIEEELGAHGAKLAIPAFTKGVSQLSLEEIVRTRRIAQVRIQVEREMERLKNFSILSGIVPMTLVPNIDNIVIICAALSNSVICPFCL